MRVGDGSFIVDASRRGGMNPLTRGGQGLQCRSAVTPPHNRREFNGRCCVIQSPASEWPWMCVGAQKQAASSVNARRIRSCSGMSTISG